MKIIHISDTHLGFSDLDVIDENGVNQREADFYKAFSDSIDKILEIKPDFVIHTGDLFHRASPSNRAITSALKQIKRLEDNDIPFIIIAGNHSTPRSGSSLPILSALETLDNVHAVYQQHYEKVEFDDIIFHALPFIHDERLIPDELEKIENSIDKSKKNILMMHCCVGASYLMGEFGEWVYPKEREGLFDEMDYVALGHWHGFGSVGGRENVYYSGSTERTSSKDKRENKGFIELVLNGNVEVTFHTIELRKSLEFEIDAKDFESEIEKLDRSGIKDAMVEVRLYNLTPSSSIDITNQSVKALFDGAMSVKIRREFEDTKHQEISQVLEPVSLEEYFLSHLQESIEDKSELERLSTKAKELFSEVEEHFGDTA